MDEHENLLQNFTLYRITYYTYYFTGLYGDLSFENLLLNERRNPNGSATFKG